MWPQNADLFAVYVRRGMSEINVQRALVVIGHVIIGAMLKTG